MWSEQLAHVLVTLTYTSTHSQRTCIVCYNVHMSSVRYDRTDEAVPIARGRAHDSRRVPMHIPERFLQRSLLAAARTNAWMCIGPNHPLPTFWASDMHAVQSAKPSGGVWRLPTHREMVRR